MRACSIVAPLLLILPAQAAAAGTVGTTAGGNVFYEGDSADNVLIVSSTLGELTSAKLIFSEQGIAEGTDAADLCTPAAGTISCDFSTLDVLGLAGLGGDDRLTLEGPVPAVIGGDAGADRVVGGEGDDEITGGADADRIEGGGGRDTVAGDAGSDVVLGGPGNDVSSLDASDGDRIDLGPGRDFFHVTNGDGAGDVLDGGDGADVLAFATLGDGAFSTVDLARGALSWGSFGPYPAGSDSLAEIEDAGERQAASNGDDVLVGDARSNLLAGGGGDDRIVGGSGADTLLGDVGLDGPDVLGAGRPGEDDIDARDGFEDRVDCGDGADSLVADQFDLPLVAACEAVESRHADPFGIAPPVPPDLRSPACRRSRLRTARRAALLRRGFSLTLRCDEPARVEVTAWLRVGRARRGAPAAGDVVLGERTLELDTGGRGLAFKVPRRLLPAPGRRLVVRLRIDATDAAGNRATSFGRFAVR